MAQVISLGIFGALRPLHVCKSHPCHRPAVHTLYCLAGASLASLASHAAADIPRSLHCSLILVSFVLAERDPLVILSGNTFGVTFPNQPLKESSDVCAETCHLTKTAQVYWYAALIQLLRQQPLPGRLQVQIV